MKQLNFETSNYDHKEELKTLTTKFNDLIEQYIEMNDERNNPLYEVERDIALKNGILEALENTGADLAKRKEELRSLKVSSTEDIKELEEKKSSIDFTDSEVKKMEVEDIDTLITSKKSKIEKIETKIQVTRSEIEQNSESIRNCKSEISDLNKAKIHEKDTLAKTEAILGLLERTQEMFNQGIENILTSDYTRPIDIEPLGGDIEIEPLGGDEVDDNFTKFFYLGEDKDFIEPLGGDEVEVPEIEPLGGEEIEPLDGEEESKEDELDEEEVTKELEAISNTSELSILDFDTVENEEDNTLIDIFKDEGLDFKDFDDVTEEKLKDNQERVIKNMLVLKNHKIPLIYTLNQSEIYYHIDPQDLDDLLNIITTDDDGNGMGFQIDYTFNILNELAKTNVDKLIDVYNTEFMNVNAKSGLIELLKKANPDIGDFPVNREANIRALNNLGVLTTSDIVSEYPEFINMDNPLFTSSLNIFDKEDLVNKLNDDIKIIPKIVEYWKNN